MPVIYSDSELRILNITKNSENVIVEKLGKDDARQLAYNILALTEA